MGGIFGRHDMTWLGRRREGEGAGEGGEEGGGG